MSGKTTSAIKVLSEKEISQKMAGFKANYSRRINQAKSSKERAALENAREEYLNSCMERIVAENKKQIQRRAGVLSWETRRANQSAGQAKVVKTVAKASSESKKSNRYSSSVKTTVVNKKK